MSNVLQEGFFKYQTNNYIYFKKFNIGFKLN